MQPYQLLPFAIKSSLYFSFYLSSNKVNLCSNDNIFSLILIFSVFKFFISFTKVIIISSFSIFVLVKINIILSSAIPLINDHVVLRQLKIKEYSPTLFLLYTKNGIKCGGYTKALWKMDEEYKYDSSSFLYNFSTRKIITIKNPN